MIAWHPQSSFITAPVAGKRLASLRGKTRALVLATSLAVAATQVFANGAAPADFVGTVTMVVGKAWIETPGAARERIADGTLIRVGDTIQTATAGMVHIRFRDAALVSVRSDSRLEVVHYDYDPAHPEASIVKLNAEEGVTRAISGDAAKSARENFRMNTPIAAIGVRGTDFVVSSNRNSVRALVNEGTIVVAPFSSQCSVDAFGPCQANSLELSGSANQIVEVRTDALNPVFLPAAGRLALPQTPDAPQRAVAVAPKPEKEETATDPYVNSVTSRAVNEKLVVASNVTTEPGTTTGGGTVAPPVVIPPVVTPPEVVPPVITPPVVTVPEFTPPAPIPPQALVTSQLLWGRWSEGNLANERITVSYAAATADNRQITVGNDSYALFRIENGSKAVKPGLGVVSFALSQAQASLNQGGNISLMSVNRGQLSIDFEASRFSTSLDLAHAATGALTFADQGLLYAGGYFHSRGATQAMAGAVSLDGTEAGYSFNKTLENGYVEGVTLWGRQP